MIRKIEIYFSLFYSLLIFIAAFSFLFSLKPLPNIDYHGKYIQLSNSMGFFLNADAYAFCELAQHPQKLFYKNEQRQSRPLYIFMGSIIYYPINGCLHFFGFNQQKNTQSTDLGTANKESQGIGLTLAPAYVSFILLNALFLFLTLILFDHLLRNAGISYINIILFALILLYNPIVKAFFWTAHQQLLNLLTPLCCIYLLMQLANRADKLSLKQISLLSFASGSLLLVYGNFLLLLPVILLGVWLNSKFKATKLKLAQFPLILIFFLTPTLLWIASLELFAEGYFSHEISSYRQFVWTIDYLQMGFIPFLKQWILYTNEFLKTLPVLTLFLVLAIFLNYKKQLKLPAQSLNLEWAAAIVLLITFIFLWFLGFYAERLSYSLLPPLIILCTLGINQNFKLSIAGPFSFIVILIWIIYQVASYGPFS